MAYARARQAAQEVAGAQDYPKGALYMVATPIGNLADVSLRALHVLGRVDVLACEDTRHTQALLRAWGLDRPPGGLMALHQHNEAEAAAQVLRRLSSGERVAYVSDAGTPAVSDPGARLAAAAHAAGIRVIPLPGASSVTALLSAAGLAGADPGFVFAGFAPAKSGERQALVQVLAGEARAVVLLESPHRVADLAKDLRRLGTRPVTVGRELTKQFEQVQTLACEALADWLDAEPARTRGEFALVLHPWTPEGPPETGQRLLELLLPELPLKTAVRIAAEATGVSRNALYTLALRLKQTERGEAGAAAGDTDRR